ncbi:MAG TPA: tetratricopeptide repeat protein [Terriglobia bacterium]|nr:tetratricopeptide repeat protein [Terriglobia bacterium]
MIQHAKKWRSILLFLALLGAFASETLAQSVQLSPVPASPSCEEAQSQAQLGREMMDQKQYLQAIAQFRAALSLCPESQEIELALIRAYIKARKFAKGESASKSFLRRFPHSEEGQVLLAYSYLMEQKVQYAGQTLQKLLAQNSKNPEGLKLMGLTLVFYKQYVLAEQELRAALALEPRDEETLYALGRVYQTQNSFGPAIEIFKKLIALNPKYYRAYDNLALCYEATGKITEADSAFEKAESVAAEVNPSDDWPYANQADMLVKDGRIDKALQCIGKAIEINPRSARNQWIMGKALLEKNDLDGAEKHARLSIKLDNSFAKAHYLLATIYRRQHKLDKAGQEFAQFKQLSEKSEVPPSKSSSNTE